MPVSYRTVTKSSPESSTPLSIAAIHHISIPSQGSESEPSVITRSKSTSLPPGLDVHLSTDYLKIYINGRLDGRRIASEITTRSALLRELLRFIRRVCS